MAACDYQDGVAVAAIQLLGKAYAPTIFTGSTSTETRNTVDVTELMAAMHQSLGLTLESHERRESGIAASQHR